MSGKVRFSIDRGGTFTDVYAEQNLSDRSVRRTVLKLLSEDPSNYPDAPREGIRRVLESFTGKSFPRSLPLDTSEIESIRMGTTVATNALLERKGEKFLLLTTKGFRDVWHIGNQSRPDIFDLTIRCPETLYDQVAEVDERVVLLSEDAQKRFQDQALEIKQAVSGEKVLVEKHLDEKAVRETLEIARKEHGIESVAVVLMHAAIYPEHEKKVGEIARQVGFKQISLSHEVMQMVKIVPRGYTTCADAYLTPHIKRYLDTFVSGFDKQLLDRVKISFMQSDGGLTRIDRFSGHKAILSGPAGGVVGYALTTRLAADTPHGKVSEQVVGFDMGGTSTDVSRFSGHYEHVFETTTAGVTIQAPQLDISTIAAGGGSKLKYVSGILQVGPESVGAHPGPVCYRKGGELAITDANVVLGRLMPEYFPKIFGPDEKQPLDAAASLSAFRDLLTVINSESGTSTKPVNLKTPEELAYGFIRVANEAMCRPIRNLTQMRGYDLAKHTLACFGGAGGQHACAIARALGMKKVFIHRYSGILSAYGIGLADVVEDQQEPCALQVTRSGEWVQEAGKSPQMVYDTFARLQGQVVEVLQAQGFTPSEMKFEFFLNMRYNGTDTPSMARSLKKDIPLGDFVNIFEEDYRREFGFQLRDRTIVIDDIRVRGSGRSGARAAQDIEISQKTGLGQQKQEQSAEPIEYRDVFFEGKWVKTPIFQLGDLMKVQGKVQGPAIILDPNSTVVVEPDCIGFVSKAGDITVDVLPKGSLSQVGSKVGAESQFDTRTVDPIQLSLFSNRFMGIAEQMGRTLQRTSVSVNIKERLDFSCALFGPDGGLVANAPHIPVHLGAMQEAIRFQHNTFEKRKGTPEQLKEGDVLVSNHPQLAGGSHLPDITVITPCFENGEIVFWVASRGHHADVGGITPGSMPPHSKMLKDEGAAIISFKLVREGEFQEEGITKILTTKSNPENPDCEGTRTLSDNLSDLRAQVAANNHGVRLVRALVQEYNLQYVQAYMRFIQENAELAVRDMLRDFVRRKGQSTVHALDRMDDGTVIKVKIAIDEKTGSADFDFAGTGPQVFGNLNAPPAVTYSAIIYSLRCLVGQDIPLNEGCLAPVTISIPRYCILNPSPESAVVGGNVLTSQRVVDVILRAFEACAASQGCMNNLTFGDHTFGYYETIAGGAGAGPTWDGRSGVHTHMTNTRITDPEIFERRYPVILREFSLRHGSGGAGEHRGGDGVVRDIEFLRPVTVSILSERRAFSPYGLLGGRDGKVGKNLLIRRGGELLESLGGKNTVPALAGDRIRLLTPGGGGFGKASMARL